MENKVEAIQNNTNQEQLFQQLTKKEIKITLNVMLCLLSVGTKSEIQNGLNLGSAGM